VIWDYKTVEEIVQAAQARHTRVIARRQFLHPVA
jgi:hypothetical protein